MYSTSLFRLLVLLSFSLCTTSGAFGQMQVFASYKAKFMPVVAFKNESLIVLDGTSRERTYDLNIKVRAATNFTEGLVTISDVQAELDVLRNASAKERANPSSVRARYRAVITSDRKLSDCYGILSFVTQGSIGTRLVPIGRLDQGRAKNIEVSMGSDLDLIGSLHVFSNGEEVRTNQHPGAYDLIKYYADLLKGVKGLSAVDLLKLEDRFPHELSSDARRLATIRKRTPDKVLMVFDLESMQMLSETVVSGEEDYVGDLTWVSDNQLVYVAANRDVNHDLDYDQALFLLDTNKGTTRKVLDNIFGIMNSTPDRPEILELHSILRGNSQFFKYNALTGKTYDYEDPDAGGYLFDAQGKPRIQFYYDGARKFYKFRPTPTSRWRDIDDLVKQPGLKFNAKASDELDRVTDILSIGPDGDTLYIASRLDSDTFQLAAFSMSEGVIKKTIAKHPKFDLTMSNGGFASLLFEKKSTRLLGMVFAAQKLRVLWIDPWYAATQKDIDTMFPDHVNIPIDWSEDGTTFIYFSYSDQDPGSYYLFRKKAGEIMPLLQLGERLKGKTLGRTLPIEFKARDGAMIPAYLTVPPETEGKLPPLIVSIHGGPMDRDTWGFNPMNQFFASRGYMVLQVNYRGSSGYGAAFQKAGLRARLDTVVLDDIADGVKDLIARNQVDPNRIAVMGGSFGGWATYMCLAKYPELFRTGIAIAAVTSWKKTLQNDKWSLNRRYSYSFWKALLEGQDYDTNAKYLDPLLRVAEIKQPVFIIHGELDRVVQPTEAKYMLAALKKQGTPVEAKSFSEASHSYWPFNDRVEMLNEIAAFLERNLPAESAEATPAKPPTN